MWQRGLTGEDLHGHGPPLEDLNYSSKTKDVHLVVTEALFSPNACEELMKELAFLRLAHFSRLSRVPAPQLFSLLEDQEVVVIVDLGFSATYVVPLVNHSIVHSAVVRLDVGGKALTNLLKELVSYRSLEMQAETHLMDQCKIATCFVAQDYDQAILDKKSLGIKYALPDYVSTNTGFVVSDQTPAGLCQTFDLDLERVLIPEVLFQPEALLGLKQAGVHECVVHAVSQCHPALQDLMYQNIVCVGGGSLFPGLTRRLAGELRGLVDERCGVDVRLGKDPVNGAVLGAQSAKLLEVVENTMSKQDFLDLVGPDAEVAPFPEYEKVHALPPTKKRKVSTKKKVVKKEVKRKGVKKEKKKGSSSSSSKKTSTSSKKDSKKKEASKAKKASAKKKKKKTKARSDSVDSFLDEKSDSDGNDEFNVEALVDDAREY